MGLLDEMLSGALGGTGAAQRPQAGGAAGGAGALMALLPVVLAMLNGRGGAGPGAAMAPGGGLGDLGGLLGQMMGGGAPAAGGLGGLGDLLGRVQQAGYGEQARSWVGTGQNLPIDTDAIGRIFGSDGLTDIARRAGLSEQEASQGLSALLPEMVDRLTPSGSLPEPGMFDASLADLQRRLGL
jgi:uncharacterized protein YidB (DUF937 family)